MCVCQISITGLRAGDDMFGTITTLTLLSFIAGGRYHGNGLISAALNHLSSDLEDNFLPLVISEGRRAGLAARGSYSPFAPCGLTGSLFVSATPNWW